MWRNERGEDDGRLGVGSVFGLGTGYGFMAISPCVSIHTGSMFDASAAYGVESNHEQAFYEVE